MDNKQYTTIETFPQPPLGLFDDIMRDIDIEIQKKRDQKRFVFSLLPCISLGILTFWIIYMLLIRIIQSGCIEFLMTAMSAGHFFSYVPDVILSLLESLPLTFIVFFFGCLFVFLISLSKSKARYTALFFRPVFPV